MNEQLIILLQIIFIDLVLAGDNAVIIGMVASQFEANYILGYWSCGCSKNNIYFDCFLSSSDKWLTTYRWFVVVLYHL